MALFGKKAGAYVPLEDPRLDPSMFTLPPNMDRMRKESAGVNEINALFESRFGDEASRPIAAKEVMQLAVEAAMKALVRQPDEKAVKAFRSVFLEGGQPSVDSGATGEGQTW